MSLLSRGLLLYFSLFILGCSGVGYRDGSLARNPKESEPVYHVVRKGDTLRSLAAHYGVSSRQLALLNGVRSGEISIGQRLLISRDGTGVRSERGATARAKLQRTSAFVPPRGGRLLWPVDGGDLVSVFGPRDGSFHDGLDIAAPEGSAIFAVQSGEVLYSDNELGGFGNLVIVRGADGLLALYGHNSRNLVKVGERVVKGQRIALVGSTGRASGPHLHFEVRLKDSQGRYVAVDPLPLMQRGALPGLRYRVNESLTPLFAKLGLE